MSKNILISPDAFKGTLSAAEVAAAVAAGVASVPGFEAQTLPVADGGEGTSEALVRAFGGHEVKAPAHDPLGREIEASFAMLDDGRAVVDVAAASGLDLIAPELRDAAAASSYGTGELIIAAAAHGATEVLVASGGSATTDGGAGAIEAIERAGGLGQTQVTVLCDVRTEFQDAARVFGPQKGADPKTVVELTQRLDRFASELPRDPRGLPLTGSAGGLSGGLWARYGAKLALGAAFVLDALDFDAKMRQSFAVITGEGKLDRQTLAGKAVGEVATRCRQAGVPCYAIVGRNELDPFDQRILDLQRIEEASSADELTEVSARLHKTL